MKNPKILIKVEGGICEVVAMSPEIDFEIRDFDTQGREGGEEKYTKKEMKEAKESGGLYKKFPNGFTSWMETHHEIVKHITLTLEIPSADGVIVERNEAQGTGGMYELAEEWTDEFEKLHQGREWDKEFFDEIQKFINSKDQA